MKKVSAGSNRQKVTVSVPQLHCAQAPFPLLSKRIVNSEHLLSADSTPGTVLNT